MAMTNMNKLEIRPKDPSKLKPISVLFNPGSYSVTKAVTWSPPERAGGSGGNGSGSERKLNAPTLTFSGGSGRQLNMDLFFDVTEPVDGEVITDVRLKTNELAVLSRIERKLGSPPKCEVHWGNAPQGSDFPFMGVLTQLTQTFTLFDRDGTPLRADVRVVFLEFEDPEKDKRQTDPELTTHVVTRGDSLHGIAASAYRNPTAWRVIAEANGVDDPRALEIGRRLTIPKIR